MHARVRPAYLDLLESGELEAKVAAAVDGLRCCRACPRECGVDRFAGAGGLCRTGRHARVASAFPHLGEEDCLRGRAGSGTIFFSLCNLRCVFCQNAGISQAPAGAELDANRIADLMLALQARGCHNVNLVTPEHVVPQVLEAVAAAAARGLELPIVYNTSAYDSVCSLRLLAGVVDIYMPDFKLWSRTPARRLLKAKDYPERARAALVEMHRQVGDLECGPDGVAMRGLLVRHLVMPGLVDESAAIFRFLASEISRDTAVNVMGQYRPAYQVGERYPAIDRRPDPRELDAALDAARAAGLWRFV